MIVVGNRQSHKVGSAGAVPDGIRGGGFNIVPVFKNAIDANWLLIGPHNGLAKQGGEKQDSMHGECPF